MNNFDFITNVLDGRLVLGDKLELSDSMFIIPIYKSKISFLDIKTDIKNNNGDGISANILTTPICILKVEQGSMEIINLTIDEKYKFKDTIPDVLANFDLNNILKNIKLN